MLYERNKFIYEKIQQLIMLIKMNEKYNNTTIGVDKNTLNMLSYLSNITSMSKKSLIGLLVEEMYSLGANYSRLFLDFDSSVTRGRLTIYFGGENKLDFRTKKVIEYD